MDYLNDRNPQPTIKALEVSQALFEGGGVMTLTKNLKLMYLCQAHHLVKHNKPLFTDEMCAWPFGPVVVSIWKNRRGVATNLPTEEIQTVREVLGFFGNWNAASLTRLTHSHRPWKNARKGVPAHGKSDAIISHESIRQFYVSTGGVIPA